MLGRGSMHIAAQVAERADVREGRLDAAILAEVFLDDLLLRLPDGLCSDAWRLLSHRRVW